MADRSLIDVTFDLIHNGHYPPAISIIDAFLTTIPDNNRSDADRKTLLINLAQSQKWSGATDKCIELINGIDWSAACEKFLLAVSVLKDDFQAAIVHAKAALHGDEIDDEDLTTWPIFKEFRNSPEYSAVKDELVLMKKREEEPPPPAQIVRSRPNIARKGEAGRKGGASVRKRAQSRK